MTAIEHSTDCDTAALGAYVEYLASFQSAVAGEVVLVWPESRAIAHADFRPTGCGCAEIQERRLVDQLRITRRRIQVLERHVEPGLTHLPLVRLRTEVELLADSLRSVRQERSADQWPRIVGDGS